MTPDEAPAWRRLSPLPLDRLAPLPALADHLDRPDVVRRLADADAARTPPDQVLAEVRSLGVAAVYDPATATAVHVNALNAVLARHSGSLAITLGVNALALLPLYIAGTPQQRDRAGAVLRAGGSAAMLLTELEHGSNLARIATRAVPDGDGWRLAGEKDLINGGRRHELLVVLARVDSGADLGMFLAERDGSVDALPAWRTLPTAAADISGVRLEGTVAQPIGAPGDGAGVLRLTLALSRGGIGSLASGAASGALAQAVAYARERDVYGEPIVHLGAIAEHLFRAAALDVLVAAAAVKATFLINTLGPAAAHATAVAKYACCLLAEEAVAEGRAVLGSRALVEEFGYAARVRDVLLYGVFDGTSHILLDQLQWRLERFAAGPGRGEDGYRTLAEAYATGPQPLVHVARLRVRPFAPNPAVRAATLAAAGARPAVGALATLLRHLLDLVGRARRSGRWATDQAWRFAAAGVLAEVEALLAAVELVDPHGRVTAGLPGRAGEVDEAALGYALGWRGAVLAARVDDLAADLAADDPPGPGPARTDDLIAAFAGERAPARAALRRWLTAPAGDRSRPGPSAGAPDGSAERPAEPARRPGPAPDGPEERPGTAPVRAVPADRSAAGASR
ncbi:acyl-CoA dehydrogenase family protein [Micromonospora humi]|uniref:acyl-CoA dehydrogenase family protein n=1 Tax=Micromonospora humi TaxID=745366 RepID=UPI001112DFDA|nr:acyl-CoA dehydrogenase family protein [Micromonospora humi]